MPLNKPMLTKALLHEDRACASSERVDAFGALLETFTLSVAAALTCGLSSVPGLTSVVLDLKTMKCVLRSVT